MCGRDNKRSGSCRQSLDSSFDIFNFIYLSASPACVRNSAGRFVCVNKKFISYFNSNIDCTGLTIDAVTGLGFDDKITLSSLELSCNSMVGITCISHDLIIMSRLWDVRIELFFFKDEVFYFWQFSPAYYSVFTAVNNNVPFHVGTNEVFIETLLTPREKEVFFLCVIYGFSKYFASRKLCVSSRTIDIYLYSIKKKILKAHLSVDDFICDLMLGNKIPKITEIVKVILKSNYVC